MLKILIHSFVSVTILYWSGSQLIWKLIWKLETVLGVRLFFNWLNYTIFLRTKFCCCSTSILFYIPINFFNHNFKCNIWNLLLLVLKIFQILLLLVRFKNGHNPLSSNVPFGLFFSWSVFLKLWSTDFWIIAF